MPDFICTSAINTISTFFESVYLVFYTIASMKITTIQIKTGQLRLDFTAATGVD